MSGRNTSGSWTRACELDLIKRPGSVETIDWANALALLGAEAVTGEAGRLTLGWAIKNQDDMRLVEQRLHELVGE
ncbi:hypothetical protein OHA45_00550 [Streptomyces lydicus]|uniref:hypothetical protein n=1 Tax=Streptomyces lydicus TaxID=47763 RepID=UPI002E369D90|nr:hypothetical protein [Streptomyces lydicus]